MFDYIFFRHFAISSWVCDISLVFLYAKSYSYHIYIIYTSYIHHIYIIYTSYIHHIYIVSGHGRWSVIWPIWLHTIHHRPSTIDHIWCIYDVYMMYIWCIYGVYMVYIWCIYDMSTTDQRNITYLTRSGKMPEKVVNKYDREWLTWLHLRPRNGPFL